jgi:hypothetical protein
MDIFTLPEHDKYAAVLLKNILGAIHSVFPDARLTINAHEATNNIVFDIQRSDGGRGVEVTEAFLDADEGLNSALHDLVDLPAQLRQLGLGEVLRVTDVGLERPVLRPWRAMRILIALQAIGLGDLWSVMEVGFV